jgi:hypothetical protein
MSDELVDVYVVLAASPNVRVERGRDGVLHVHVGPITVHADRGTCEELATTLARAISRIGDVAEDLPAPNLRLIHGGKRGDP